MDENYGWEHNYARTFNKRTFFGLLLTMEHMGVRGCQVVELTEARSLGTLPWVNTAWIL